MNRPAQKPRGVKCAWILWTACSMGIGALINNSLNLFQSTALQPTPDAPAGAPPVAPCRKDGYGTCVDAGCDRWYDGCNHCRVGADGALACTRKGCPLFGPPAGGPLRRRRAAHGRAVAAALAAAVAGAGAGADAATLAAALASASAAPSPRPSRDAATAKQALNATRVVAVRPAAAFAAPGATWQFNALKEILKAATSLDVKTAHSDGDSADFDACLAAPPCLLKTHAFVPRLLPLVNAARGPRRNRRNRRNANPTQVFTSHRDLRDVLLSSMQMFGSCLGFGPEGLHSRDAAGSAAAHDVAPRFQQYAKWVPFACYDMAYERMYGDRPGEVDRLAAALGVGGRGGAAAVVDAVEALAAQSAAATAPDPANGTGPLEHWDAASGFAAHHVHESTSAPGAFARARTLVHVGLHLPGCNLPESFEQLRVGFGDWQVARGYDGASAGNAFVDSLPGALAARRTARVFPRVAHVVFAGDDATVDATLDAADAARAAAPWLDVVVVDARRDRGAGAAAAGQTLRLFLRRAGPGRRGPRGDLRPRASAARGRRRPRRAAGRPRRRGAPGGALATPLRDVEGADRRALRLVEWLCGAGHEVTLVSRGHAKGYRESGAPPAPASGRIFLPRTKSSRACSVAVKSDDGLLGRVLTSSFLAAKQFDLALLEVNFDERFGASPRRASRCAGSATRDAAARRRRLGLLLSSHADWADDPRLRGLLTGTRARTAAAALTRGRRDAALDASLLDALRLAVRLDDAGAPWGEA
ncbi:hypothetical protein JL722_6968 [Aureococcus anophagefferens]|nr:hypothetical protein JL722_6968 [Aureococcus anophagefferens]